MAINLLRDLTRSGIDNIHLGVPGIGKEEGLGGVVGKGCDAEGMNAI